MKERPIIFSSESIQAILEGRKTQTRRVVKEQPNRVRYNNIVMSGKYGWEDEHGRRLLNLYGEPGDRLWVRETCKYGGYINSLMVSYKARKTNVPQIQHVGKPKGWESFREKYSYKWCSSIHMPRWASRITLEITDIRVERVQEISKSDCIAEGVLQTVLTNQVYNTQRTWYELAGDSRVWRNPIDAYMEMWNDINLKRGYPWSDNPWVWVIEFKRLERDR